MAISSGMKWLVTAQSNFRSNLGMASAATSERQQHSGAPIWQGCGIAIE
jgi:hypothetical protein